MKPSGVFSARRWLSWPRAVIFVLLAACGAVELAAERIASADDLARHEEQAMLDAVSRIAASVVRIQTVGGLGRVGRVDLGDGPGTGVVVSADGYIISSSFNFARQPSTILVELPDGANVPAKLVARDNSRSLVLLKVTLPDNSSPLTVPEAANGDRAVPGAWAIAVGRTFDAKQPNVSVGIISGRNRIWGKAVQTDAKISANNYGGPLVDIRGRVFGILAPLSPISEGEVAGVEWYDSGIGFAIPWAHIQKVLPSLKAGKDLHRGRMGISLRGRDQFGAEPIVAASQPGSPAYKAGIRTGDKIISVNGVAVKSHAQLRHQVGPMYAGEVVSLSVKRASATLDFQFELTDKLLPYAHPFLGVLPSRDGGAEPGVAIRFVFPAGPAAVAGLKPGDRITAIAETELASVDSAYETLGGLAVGEQVRVVFLRDGKSNSVDVSLAKFSASVPDALPAAGLVDEGDKAEERNVAVGTIEIKLPEFKNECLAYVPENYSANRGHGIVVVLPQPGAFDKRKMVRDWKDVCDRRQLILLVPRPRDAQKWNRDEVEFIDRTVLKVVEDYRVDESRVVVYGQRVSAAMAAVYFNHPKTRARGLAMVGGVMPAGMRIRPLSPVNRSAIYWARGGESAMVERADRQIEQLRAANYPVTTTQLGAAQGIDENQRPELVRWIDSLDRF